MTTNNRPRPDQPRQPAAGVSVAGDGAGGDRAAGVGRADGRLLRRHGFRVAIVDAEAEELSPDEAAERVERPEPAAGGGRRLRTSAVRLDADHDGGREPSARRSRTSRPSARCCWSADTWRRCPSGRCDEEAADFVAGGEGLYTLVDLLEALQIAVPGLCAACATCGIATAAHARSADRRRRWCATSMARCPASPGTCCRWTAIGPTTGTASASRRGSRTRPSTRRSAAPTTAASAASRRRSRAARRSCGLKATANSYRFWSPSASSISCELLARALRRAARQDRRRDVRPQPPARRGICDVIIERGLDLNLWAYARVDTVKDGPAGKAQAGRLQLAGARHRGRQRARAGRRGEGLRPGGDLRAR